MTHEEVQELIEKAVRSTTAGFIGQKATKEAADVIKGLVMDSVANVIKDIPMAYRDMYEIPPYYDIEVKLDGHRATVNILVPPKYRKF